MIWWQGIFLHSCFSASAWKRSSVRPGQVHQLTAWNQFPDFLWPLKGFARCPPEMLFCSGCFAVSAAAARGSAISELVNVSILAVLCSQLFYPCISFSTHTRLEWQHISRRVYRVPHPRVSEYRSCHCERGCENESVRPV